MHDENSDLHFYRADDFGLVHCHTRRGAGYLLFKLGEAEMARYHEEQGYQIRLTLGGLGKLLDDAALDGLSTELTVPARGEAS